jgi:nucleotide-binding universal stress UspA family protein
MHEIVTGIDSSPGAAEALRWAVREGELRDRQVTAVLSWGLLDQHHPDRTNRFDPRYGDKEAHEALAGYVRDAVGAEAAATVRLHTTCDLPAHGLLDASAGADLLVVGARGLGGFRSLLLGSVSEQCLHHATCPVAVVRDLDGDHGGAERRTERVVVGYDGSDAARAALRWAIAEARARQATLQVTHAWMPAVIDGNAYMPVPADMGALAETARTVLEAGMTDEDTSGIAVEATQPCGPAASALLDAAADATLVVVGSRGRGGFAGLLLGSVGLQVARHAPCPVVVAPYER